MRHALFSGHNAGQRHTVEKHSTPQTEHLAGSMSQYMKPTTPSKARILSSCEGYWVEPNTPR